MDFTGRIRTNSVIKIHQPQSPFMNGVYAKGSYDNNEVLNFHVDTRVICENLYITEADMDQFIQKGFDPFTVKWILSLFKRDLTNNLTGLSLEFAINSTKQFYPMIEVSEVLGVIYYLLDQGYIEENDDHSELNPTHNLNFLLGCLAEN